MQEIKKERESMIYPTLEELSKQGKYNRYAITMAAAKGARMVTEEYVMEREHAEQLIARKETDKPLTRSCGMRKQCALRCIVCATGNF